MERPIIFSTEMVKAILDDIKTMTRRVIKPQPVKCGDDHKPNWQGQILDWVGDKYEGREHWFCYTCGNGLHAYDEWSSRGIICPYGQVGDRLWVRETWAYGYTNQYPDRIIYKADNTLLPTALERGTYSASAGWGKWAPSIHMFRKDSRLTLEITDLRAERLQEINIEDAFSEATPMPYERGDGKWNDPYVIPRFQELWDSLNAKRGYGWETNPWVWVIKFDNIGVRVK